jgi:hypothetical protein
MPAESYSNLVLDDLFQVIIIQADKNKSNKAAMRVDCTHYSMVHD